VRELPRGKVLVNQCAAKRTAQMLTNIRKSTVSLTQYGRKADHTSTNQGWSEIATFEGVAASAVGSIVNVLMWPFSTA
jgi:hypothetical protein